MPENRRTETVRPEYLEHWKHLIDYLKHLTTLSTGSVVVMATFLEKLVPSPLWKGAAVLSIAGFLLSVVGATVALTFSVIFESPIRRGNQTPDWVKGIGMLSLMTAWLGFLVGVAALAVFAIRNLMA